VKKINKIKKGARILVETCGNVRHKDKVLILVDDSTLEIGRHLYSVAKETTSNLKLISLPKARIHGEEPADEIAKEMLDSNVIFCVTTFSLAHSEARKKASDNGARFLSLPDYSLDLLCRSSLDVDYFKQAKYAQKIKKIFDQGKEIRVTTKKGTDIEIEIGKRKGNYCPGFCFLPGTLGSPPDIETNIPPIEDKSEGRIVADGSIPCKEIGLIKGEILIEVKNGSIIDIDTGHKQGKILNELLRNDSRKKVLAEFGIGLNPRAKLCGIMLEDEGCLGTAHFGFGSNCTIGGKNKVKFHIDLVIQKPDVIVDGKTIMRGGFNN